MTSTIKQATKQENDFILRKKIGFIDEIQFYDFSSRIQFDNFYFTRKSMKDHQKKFKKYQ